MALHPHPSSGDEYENDSQFADNSDGRRGVDARRRHIHGERGRYGGDGRGTAWTPRRASWSWHLLGKLGLSAAQKQQIKDIMAAAHPQMQSLHEQMRANSLKMRQVRPTDPNYANVVSLTSQTHGTLSAQMMAQRADLRAQVFKVLTPEQQTQLATLEAQSRLANKHGAWGGARGAAPDAPPN